MDALDPEILRDMRYSKPKKENLNQTKPNPIRHLQFDVNLTLIVVKTSFEGIQMQAQVLPSNLIYTRSWYMCN